MILGELGLASSLDSDFPDTKVKLIAFEANKDALIVIAVVIKLSLFTTIY